MAVKTERVRYCDLCGSTEDVSQFKINYVSVPQTLSVDLCPEHSAGLEAIRAALPGGKRGRTRGQAVTTKAEIAREKTRKSPARKRGSSTATRKRS